jgi:hypothetical protein
MYVCAMDHQGKKLVHTNVKHNDFDYFLKLGSLCNGIISLLNRCEYAIGVCTRDPDSPS